LRILASSIESTCQRLVRFIQRPSHLNIDAAHSVKESICLLIEGGDRPWETSQWTLSSKHYLIWGQARDRVGHVMQYAQGAGECLDPVQVGIDEQLAKYILQHPPGHFSPAIGTRPM